MAGWLPTAVLGEPGSPDGDRGASPAGVGGNSDGMTERLKVSLSTELWGHLMLA